MSRRGSVLCSRRAEKVLWWLISFLVAPSSSAPPCFLHQPNRSPSLNHTQPSPRRCRSHLILLPHPKWLTKSYFQPYFLRGVLGNTLCFFWSYFWWYFRVLSEWCYLRSLTSRTSSNSRIHYIPASPRRSRECAMEAELGLPDIWLLVRHELRIIQS